MNSAAKILPGISYQRSMLKPFSLYSEMCSGPGASSQIGIWEYATVQVIRVVESVTGASLCVCMHAQRSPDDSVSKMRTVRKPCHWLLDMETKQLETLQTFVCSAACLATKASHCQGTQGTADWFTCLLCWYHWHTPSLFSVWPLWFFWSVLMIGRVSFS